MDSLGGGWKSETARVAIYGISRILITLQLICTKARKTFCLLLFHFSIYGCTWFFIVYDFLFGNCTTESRKQTLPKAQRTRGLSSSFQSNLLGHITSKNANLDQTSSSKSRPSIYFMRINLPTAVSLIYLRYWRKVLNILVKCVETFEGVCQLWGTVW